MNKITLTIGAISAATISLGTAVGILAAKVADKNRRIENLKANLERSTEETEYTREYWKDLLENEEDRSEKYYKDYLKMQDKYMAAADYECKYHELYNAVNKAANISDVWAEVDKNSKEEVNYEYK